ncbi:MAG: dihydroneopterin aldolase [Nitrospira sp.]|nr:dihydroneopterin aldolase [Nitrospira sp.]
MIDRIVVERLEFLGHCGVTPEERQNPQPIVVDLALDYPPDAFPIAAATGDIARALDYAQVAERVVAIGTGQAYTLLETLADRLAAMILAEFPVTALSLWVRKTSPPLKQISGSVGVRVERSRSMATSEAPPAQFLQEHWHRLPKGTVLDLAAGQGRNALFLAAKGYAVEGVDRDESALAALADAARQRRIKHLTLRHLDMESGRDLSSDFPGERYDAIVVFFYLHRPLFPMLLRALKPGGMLIYETFLIDNHLRHHHPRRQEFCLAHNELLRLAEGLRVLHYDEGAHTGGQGHGPSFTARLLAEKEPA